MVISQQNMGNNNKQINKYLSKYYNMRKQNPRNVTT